MLSIDEARRLIAESLRMLPPERVALGVALGQALGRLLRGPVVAGDDLPTFDRSAFDGYAFLGKGTAATLRLTGSVAAGQVSENALSEGECARIFTGAPLPDGSDTVAMQEACSVEGTTIGVPALPPGDGVRKRGEDARAGAVLISGGVRLGAVELSLMAQLGYTQPLVATRPGVFHVRTGDEIVSPDAEPGGGQIRDSNSTLLAGLIAEAGAELRGQVAVPDSLDALTRACAAGEQADLLLISGGASVGDYDFGRAALAELGYSIRFAGLNLRPGKPLIFATRGRSAAFVIPGNPLSHFVCWHVVMSAAFQLLKCGVSELRTTQFRLGGAKALRGNPRDTWWPARAVFRDGIAMAEPLKWQSSGDLTGLAGVDALIRIPSGSAGLEPGGLVDVLRV
jgi:molybdopterin molybdotransferase